MAKADIKLCRYKCCNHKIKTIDITSDEYKKIKTKYYHKDCYDRMIADEEKQKKISADMQLIKNLWIENISQTVVISLLFKVINEFLERGISSDYLVFVLQYVISHHYNLNHPFGFKYYVDRNEIKAEYQKKQRRSIPQDAFNVVEAQDECESPRFSVPQRNRGFGSIIRGGNQ